MTDTLEPVRDHMGKAKEALAFYDRERISPSLDRDDRESFLNRLLAEAQVHATLAVAAELEAHRLAGWGRPA